MNHKQYRKSLIKFMYDLIKHHTNIYYFVMTFVESTPDDVAEESIKHLLHLINQKLYGRRYEQANKYIEGVITRERTSTGTMHYNLLLVGHGKELPGYSDLLLILSNAVKKLKQYDAIKGIYTDRDITDTKGCSLQTYTNDGENRLEQYITKNFDDDRCSIQSAIDSVGFIKGRDLTFGSDCLEQFYRGSLRGFYSYENHKALRQSN